MMMSDIRGFTPLSEHLDPEKVLEMLNAYFELMMEIILKYNGTINEIIGDSILVIFGAPQQMADRCQRAVACAIEMQNAMTKVNSQNRNKNLPQFEIGIGLNESEVIVGNIGSKKRSKYGVVGSGVNMASRIESFTVGGSLGCGAPISRAEFLIGPLRCLIQLPPSLTWLCRTSVATPPEEWAAQGSWAAVAGESFSDRAYARFPARRQKEVRPSEDRPRRTPRPEAAS